MFTEKVIFWLDEHEYSKQHWKTAADDFLEKSSSKDEAIEKLAVALKNFHIRYKTALIKPDNVLFELLEMCFDDVDWISVAKTRFED